MILGFIGTGNISSDVVTGICNSNIKFKIIFISPRNKKKAYKLKKKFKKVFVAKSNQDVIDKFPDGISFEGWTILVNGIKGTGEVKK